MLPVLLSLRNSLNDMSYWIQSSVNLKRDVVSISDSFLCKLLYMLVKFPFWKKKKTKTNSKAYGQIFLSRHCILIPNLLSMKILFFFWLKHYLYNKRPMLWYFLSWGPSMCKTFPPKSPCYLDSDCCKVSPAGRFIPGKKKKKKKKSYLA